MTHQTIWRFKTVAFTLCALAIGAATAAAQSTLTLTDSSATTLRGGSYASTNFSHQTIIETRASSDASYVRRGLLKFDTHTTLPEGTPIASAKLTITVAGGSAETRTLSAYNENSSVRRKRRHVEIAQVGGLVVEGRRRHRRPLRCALDYQQRGFEGHLRRDGARPGRRPRRLRSELTLYARRADRRGWGERQFLQADLFGRGDRSFDPADAHHLVRLRCGPAPVPAPVPAPITSGGGTTLRVLQWNTHHGGYGTDGIYDTNRLATWIGADEARRRDASTRSRSTRRGATRISPRSTRACCSRRPARPGTTSSRRSSAHWTSNGKGNLILSTLSDLVSPTATSWCTTPIAASPKARITVNGRRDHADLTHLDPYRQSLRLTQATEVTTWAAAQPENRILTGDMNAWPDQTSIAQLDKLLQRLVGGGRRARARPSRSPATPARPRTGASTTSSTRRARRTCRSSRRRSTTRATRTA